VSDFVDNLTLFLILSVIMQIDKSLIDLWKIA